MSTLSRWLVLGAVATVMFVMGVWRSWGIDVALLKEYLLGIAAMVLVGVVLAAAMATLVAIFNMSRRARDPARRQAARLTDPSAANNKPAQRDL